MKGSLQNVQSVGLPVKMAALARLLRAPVQKIISGNVSLKWYLDLHKNMYSRC